MESKTDRDYMHLSIQWRFGKWAKFTIVSFNFDTFVCHLLLYGVFARNPDFSPDLTACFEAVLVSDTTSCCSRVSIAQAEEKQRESDRDWEKRD